jgi:hypothetical protein
VATLLKASVKAAVMINRPREAQVKDAEVTVLATTTAQLSLDVQVSKLPEPSVAVTVTVAAGWPASVQ